MTMKLAKAASLFTTDPSGQTDLPEHPMTRYYFISSHQHGTGNAGSKGNCQQFQNPLDSAPVLTAARLLRVGAGPPPDPACILQ